MRKIGNLLAQAMPTGILAGLFPIGLFIPYYHLVGDLEAVHVKHLFPHKNVREFVADIEFLASHGHAVGLKDVIDHVQGRATLRNPSFLLTFDDGYSEMASVVAPILLRKGIPAAFFLNPGFIDNAAMSFANKASLLVEEQILDPGRFREGLERVPAFRDIPPEEAAGRILAIPYRQRGLVDEIAGAVGLRFDDYLRRRQPYLSGDQIRDMIRDGFCFGGHSLDHPLYADLSLEDQIQQTLASVNLVRERFQLDYSAFAFPHYDRLVTRTFFERIRGSVDVTFGTAGILTDQVAPNLQRINFEKTLQPARAILARQILKKRVYRWLDKDVISRGEK